MAIHKEERGTKDTKTNRNASFRPKSTACSSAVRIWFRNLFSSNINRIIFNKIKINEFFNYVSLTWANPNKISAQEDSQMDGAELNGMK